MGMPLRVMVGGNGVSGGADGGVQPMMTVMMIASIICESFIIIRL